MRHRAYFLAITAVGHMSHAVLRTITRQVVIGVWLCRAGAWPADSQMSVQSPTEMKCQVGGFRHIDTSRCSRPARRFKVRMVILSKRARLDSSTLRPRSAAHCVFVKSAELQRVGRWQSSSRGTAARQSAGVLHQVVIGVIKAATRGLARLPSCRSHG